MTLKFAVLEILTKISHVQEKYFFDPLSLIDVVKNYRHVRSY